MGCQGLVVALHPSCHCIALHSLRCPRPPACLGACKRVQRSTTPALVFPEKHHFQFMRSARGQSSRRRTPRRPKPFVGPLPRYNCQMEPMSATSHRPKAGQHLQYQPHANSVQQICPTWCSQTCKSVVVTNVRVARKGVRSRGL